MGANSLLDTVIFGRRAGAAAATYAKERRHSALSDAALSADRDRIRVMLDRDTNGDSVAKIRLAMGQTMNEHLAVFRNEEGMQTAVSTVRQLKERYTRAPVRDKGKVFNTALVFGLELGFMLDCAEGVCLSALARKESRGAHFRTDLPQRDDVNFLKHSVISYSPDGPHIDFSPVTITRWPPEKRVY